MLYYIVIYHAIHRQCFSFFFFLMIRRPPRSTLDRSSAASDVYKRQHQNIRSLKYKAPLPQVFLPLSNINLQYLIDYIFPVSYTHLRAHETVLDLVCRLLLEKKKLTTVHTVTSTQSYNIDT